MHYYFSPDTRHPIPCFRLSESYHCDKQTTKFSPFTFPGRAFAGTFFSATVCERTITESSKDSPDRTKTPSPRTDRLRLAPASTVTPSHQIDSRPSPSPSTFDPLPA